jgi:hypothetical protein
MLQSPPTRTSLSVRVAKSAVLGFPLSCRFFIRGEPPLAEPLPQENKTAASEAPFQDRRTLRH